MDTKPTIYHICPDIGNDNRLMSTTLYIVQSIPYILVLPPPMALMDLFCFPSVVFGALLSANCTRPGWIGCGCAIYHIQAKKLRRRCQAGSSYTDKAESKLNVSCIIYE